MPMCGAKKPKTDEEMQSEDIDKTIKKEKKQFMMTYRVPVVGAGESGKSTLIKQMQILYITGFTSEEKMEKVRDMRKNISDAMLSITSAMDRIDPPVKLENPDNQFRVEYIQSEANADNFEFPPIFFEHCIALWKDKGVQEAFSRANEYQLIDSAKYFLDKAADLAKPDFMPDNQDILRCRVLTSGIFETMFTMNKINFHMFDVGGQRDERRKWIQVFHDITAVIFVCATSGYDMTLRELATQNRLKESLDLFNEVWNNRFLRQNSAILFLNKQDLFESKILSKKTKLETYFPKFSSFPQPPPDPENKDEDPELCRAKYFIREMFINISKKGDDNSRRCYPHFTTAIDTENIKRVFNDCKDMLMRMNMQKLGLI